MARASRVTGWVGWIWFAAVLLLMAGVFNALNGLVAIMSSEAYITTTRGLLVLDLTGWGWWHLFLGALLVVAGIALFSGRMWARVIAVILAALNAVTQLLFLPASPIWSILVIVLDVVIIWALTVHGAEAEAASREV